MYRDVRTRKPEGQVCQRSYCEKPAQTAGLCAMHYTMDKRAEVARAEARNIKGKLPPLEDWHCVYVIGCDEFEPLKVGRSSNVQKRIVQCQTGCPYQLKLRGAVFAPKEVIVWLEWIVQRKLEEKGFRLQGEWFDAKAEDAVKTAIKCAEIEKMPFLTLREFVSGVRDAYQGLNPKWVHDCEVLLFMAYGFDM